MIQALLLRVLLSVDSLLDLGTEVVRSDLLLFDQFELSLFQLFEARGALGHTYITFHYVLANRVRVFLDIFLHAANVVINIVIILDNGVFNDRALTDLPFGFGLLVVVLRLTDVLELPGSEFVGTFL